PPPGTTTVLGGLQHLSGLLQLAGTRPPLRGTGAAPAHRRSPSCVWPGTAAGAGPPTAAARPHEGAGDGSTVVTVRGQCAGPPGPGRTSAGRGRGVFACPPGAVSCLLARGRTCGAGAGEPGFARPFARSPSVTKRQPPWK